MTTLILKSKREIVITDYVDYPVLHLTISYTGIFSRKLSVVLHASLTEMSFEIKHTIKQNFRLKLEKI